MQTRRERGRNSIGEERSASARADSRSFFRRAGFSRVRKGKAARKEKESGGRSRGAIRFRRNFLHTCFRRESAGEECAGERNERESDARGRKGHAGKKRTREKTADVAGNKAIVINLCTLITVGRFFHTFSSARRQGFA